MSAGYLRGWTTLPSSNCQLAGLMDLEFSEEFLDILLDGFFDDFGCALFILALV